MRIIRTGAGPPRPQQEAHWSDSSHYSFLGDVII